MEEDINMAGTTNLSFDMVKTEALEHTNADDIANFDPTGAKKGVFQNPPNLLDHLTEQRKRKQDHPGSIVLQHHPKFLKHLRNDPGDQCDFSAAQSAAQLKTHMESKPPDSLMYPYDQWHFNAVRSVDAKMLEEANKYQQQQQQQQQRGQYPCNQCDFLSSQAGNLKTHKNSKHDGVKYPCTQCSYSATQSGNLRTHRERKHQNLRFPCDQCDYVATQSGNLKTHKASKHEGVKYPCDQCSYVATQPGNLKTHKDSKHRGVRYPCDQCNYAATQFGNLKTHKRRKHKATFQDLSSVATQLNI